MTSPQEGEGEEDNELEHNGGHPGDELEDGDVFIEPAAREAIQAKYSART